MTIIIFILGLAFGSFANVLIDRLPRDMSLGGRSHCDHCGKVLSTLELIPVLSWVIQRGSSACCHKKLSAQYPFVELLMGITFLIFWNTFMSFWYIAVGFALVVIFFTDVKDRIIPDEMNILLSIVGFVILFIERAPYSNILAGLTLSAFLYLLHVMTKGNGMGLGDVKFAFPMGLFLGLWGGFLAMYVAFIGGGLFALFLLLFGKAGRKSMIAFGPFLILGFVAVLFFGDFLFAFIKGYLLFS